MDPPPVIQEQEQLELSFAQLDSSDRQAKIKVRPTIAFFSYKMIGLIIFYF
jgi:hypothetical protein